MVLIISMHRRFYRKKVVVVAYLTLLTDPLRIQPWSQDRRNQTKSNREHRKQRQKKTDKKVASKGHRRQEATKKRDKNKNKSTRNRNTNRSTVSRQIEETNKRQPHTTLLSKLRKKGSPISGRIQPPRQDDKGKDNE